MKKAFYALTVLFAILFSVSCNSGNQKKNDEAPLVQYDTLVLDTAQSLISWVREVENKVENKQVKIFGMTANVNIENAQFTTNGNIKPLEGQLITGNDTLRQWNILADFMMIRLFSENSNKALSTEKFPPTKLDITKITPDSANQYSMEGSLTIKNTTKSVQWIGAVIKDHSAIEIKGEFKIQTLDFPIREEAKKENVIKDEIVFTLNLRFWHKNGKDQ